MTPDKELPPVCFIFYHICGGKNNKPRKTFLRMWLLWFFCHTGWKRRWGGENLSRVTESVVFQSSKSDLWERGNYLFGVRSLGFALFLRRPGAAFKAASSRRTPKDSKGFGVAFANLLVGRISQTRRISSGGQGMRRYDNFSAGTT